MSQIPQHLVNLIHIALGIVMLHAQLVAIGLANGAGLICPGIPYMTLQIVDIVRLLLPNPQQLVHSRLDELLADCEDGKFLLQIITVDHTKQLDCMGGASVFPTRTHLLVGIPDTLSQNVFAILNEYGISVAH